MSVQTLTERDEIVVFAYAHSQDDMGNWLEGTSTVRRTMKCRMHPMGGDNRVLHDIPIETEAYTALFSYDPELSLHHKAIYDGKVFSVVGTNNRSGQGWLWEAALAHDPGLGIDV